MCKFSVFSISTKFQSKDILHFYAKTDKPHAKKITCPWCGNHFSGTMMLLMSEQ